MRSSAKTSLRLIALCAAAIGSVWIGIRAADEVEWRSLVAVSDALAQAGFSWSTVETDGLIARVSGEAPDEATRFRVMTVAGAVLNPANLRDGMTVSDEADATPPEFRLELLRSGQALTIHGLVPASTSEAEPLAQRISGIAPDLRLSNLVTPVDAPPPEGWAQTLDAGLMAVRGLENSRVLITSDEVQVTGLAPADVKPTAMEEKLRRMLPTDVALTIDLRAPRKVVSPFIARFRLTPEGGVTDACSTNTEEGRRLIEAAAADAGIDVVGHCAVVLGAPDPSWDRAVVIGLQELAAIGDGTLTLSDLSLTLVPGPGAVPELRDTAATDLERTMPGIFNVSVPVAQSDTADGPARDLTFRATLDDDGTMVVHGPLPDRDSVSVVQSLARAQFQADKLSLDLRQQPGLPDRWTIRILAALDEFARIETGKLTVTPSLIEIVGKTGFSGASTDIAAGLTAALGTDTLFELEIDYDKMLDPIAALPSPQECIDRIRAIQAETKITFAPGSVELDTASLAIVRSIADVLRKCPDVPIEIGGHTDSQGRDEMNEKLSQQRADAVLRALVARRILTSNLTAKGYGESQPEADNGTTEGREANRRIEFAVVASELAAEDEGSPSDAPPPSQTEPEDGSN